MLPARKILKRSHHLLTTKPKLLLNRNRQPARHDKPNELHKLLPRADHDAAHHRTFGQRKPRDVRQLLARRGQESNDRDDAAVGNGLETLLDCAGAAVLKDVVDSPAVGELLDLGSPVGRRLVVDDVVCAVLLLDKLQFGVGGGRDDGCCAGRLGEDQACERDTPGP